jgi:hypothetical protein
MILLTQPKEVEIYILLPGHPERNWGFPSRMDEPDPSSMRALRIYRLPAMRLKAIAV